MKNLKTALYLNAVFSAFCGTALIIFPQFFSRLFEVEQIVPFLLVGAGLIPFAFWVFYVSRKNPTPLGQALIVIFLDIIWVVVSIIALTLDILSISLYGKLLVAGVALMVFGFAFLQSFALAYIDSAGHKAVQKEFNFNRIVKANNQLVWKVVADLENYHNVAPNIDSTQIVSGKGKGMIRTCSSGRDSWSETCTAWNPGEKYTFVVDTQAPDYPYPFKFLRGTWSLNNISEQEQEINIYFKVEYHHFFHALLVHPFVGPSFNEICEELLDNWQREIQALIELPEPSLH